MDRHTKILKGIANEKEISEIAFFWQFETVDPYGTKKVDNVMKIILIAKQLIKLTLVILSLKISLKQRPLIGNIHLKKRIIKNKSRQMTALIFIKLFFCINFLGETQKSASKRNRFSHYT